MNCAWKELLGVLPPVLRQSVDKLGETSAQEIRVRLGRKTELIAAGRSIWLDVVAKSEDMHYVINAASKYSPWAAATSCYGYLTAPGGHRIGICGECVTEGEKINGVKNITSLCIRVARDFPGIADRAARISGSLLIIGPPGSGKTTLLRDLIRLRSESGAVAVVDERGELFPVGAGFLWGSRTDVLTGCMKPQGILMALKTMGPKVIAVDEITAQEDCQALKQAGWCGVEVLASVHAYGKQDLLGRPIYHDLITSGLFSCLIILQPDKTWRTERITI